MSNGFRACGQFFKMVPSADPITLQRQQMSTTMFLWLADHRMVWKTRATSKLCVGVDSPVFSVVHPHKTQLVYVTTEYDEATKAFVAKSNIMYCSIREGLCTGCAMDF